MNKEKIKGIVENLEKAYEIFDSMPRWYLKEAIDDDAEVMKLDELIEQAIDKTDRALKFVDDLTVGKN